MSIFSRIEKPRVKSNTFNLTHDVKTTTNFGVLTPIMVQECLPGDRWNIKGNALVRLAPQIAPVMHRANVYCHYFFVPNRLTFNPTVANNWENFITGGKDGLDNTAHPVIRFPSGDPSYDVGKLADYMGLPVHIGGSTDAVVNAFPFAAYQKIYNDY